MSLRTPRLINLVLGIWLFVSAFLWHHEPSHFHDDWIAGALIALTALVGMAWPATRAVNVILAVWLFMASWVLPETSRWTMLNELAVAAIVFFVALSPSAAAAWRERRT